MKKLRELENNKEFVNFKHLNEQIAKRYIDELSNCISIAVEQFENCFDEVRIKCNISSIEDYIYIISLILKEWNKWSSEDKVIKEVCNKIFLNSVHIEIITVNKDEILIIEYPKELIDQHIIRDYHYSFENNLKCDKIGYVVDSNGKRCLIGGLDRQQKTEECYFISVKIPTDKEGTTLFSRDIVEYGHKCLKDMFRGLNLVTYPDIIKLKTMNRENVKSVL